MEQIEIWDIELAINNILFNENKKDDSLVSLTKIYSSNKEIFDNFISELVAIKEASRKLSKNSSKDEILNTIKEAKQRIKDRMETPIQSFEDRKRMGPLLEKDKRNDSKMPRPNPIRNREKDSERLKERDTEKMNRLMRMHKNEEKYPFLNKENLQVEYDAIKTYNNFQEIDNDTKQMFCFTDMRRDVAFNVFLFIEENRNGQFKFTDIAERYGTDDNSSFLAKEYIETKKTLQLSKIETIKTDKVFFSLNDNFHNSPNSFKKCLKIIAEHISNERLGIFKEPSEFKYIVIHTQEKRLTLYRLIASLSTNIKK